MQIKLTSRQKGCLEEAFRRFECFAVRRDSKKWTLEDMQEAWTGLGVPSSYKAVKEAGFMKPLEGKENGEKRGKRWVGYDTWYLLTETGAKIVLKWHEMGFKCEGYEAPKGMPNEIEVN